MNTSANDPKSQFKYFKSSNPKLNFPRFDVDSPLPKAVEPTARYRAHLGLQLLPTLPLLPPFNWQFLSFLVKKLGFQSMAGPMLQSWMPANLSKIQLDNSSDDYFVERRLNGFNPGKLNKVDNQEWQYAVRYKTSRYSVKPGGILPEYSEARFTLKDQALHAHSIEYCLKEQKVIATPQDGQGWDLAKHYFRSTEYVYQEIQSHLGRTHMNMDQYAMAFYRNVSRSPIRDLLLPHFEGLISIDKKGASLIIGNTGFIPKASALDPLSVEETLIEEIAQLSYHWTPKQQSLPDVIHNNYFDRAALGMWELLEKYVDKYFGDNQADIKRYWPEIEGMSEDLVQHSVLKPEYGTLAIQSEDDLKKLCVYVIYHCTFFHSWVNNKQYEDGGNPSYAAIGLWEANYDPKKVKARHDSQVRLMWILANVHYNPAIQFAPTHLKKLLWDYRDRLEPGIPIDWIMMSINI